MVADKHISIMGIFEKLYYKMNAPSLSQKTNFFRLLSLAQNAGLGARDALFSIRKSEKSPGLLMIINSLIDELTQGKSFSDSLSLHSDVFKNEEIALIRAAEAMGNIPEVLQEIAMELENNQKINQKVKKASTYPIILVFFSAVAVVILLVFVIPTIVGMFPSQDQLPAITKFMISASDFLKYYWYVIFFVIGSVVVGYRLLYAYVLPFKKFIDKAFITIPAIAGVVKTFYMYRFTNLLSQLYVGGISPVVALLLIADVFDNYYYKKKTVEIQNDLKSGFTFGESMEGSLLFDPILVQIIHVGEETGNMADVLKRISVFYRELLQNKIDILMAFIEPFLMAFIAIIIGVIVGSIFIPMAELVNVMK